MYIFANNTERHNEVIRALLCRNYNIKMTWRWSDGVVTVVCVRLDDKKCGLQQRAARENLSD